MEELFTSQRGVRFTARTVQVMREFRKVIQREGGLTIGYSAARLADGSLTVALGGDYEAPPNAIRDHIGDRLGEVEFFWYAEPELLSAVAAFDIDTSHNHGTRLIAREGDVEK